MLKHISEKIRKHWLISGYMCMATILLLFLLVSLKQIAIIFISMTLLLFCFDLIYYKILTTYIKQKLVKTGFIVLLIGINLIGSVSVTVYIASEKIFFYPNQDMESYNKNLHNQDFEEINIKNGDTNIAGWLRKNSEEKAPLILYFGGNGECSARRFHINYELGYWERFNDYNFMMVDYPGYGNSTGTPSDKAMFQTALDTYDYISTREDIDTNHIIVMGYSIGTGVATYLASQRDVDGLILMAPYDNGTNLYNSKLNIFHGPLKLLVRYQFNSTHYAKSVSIKPLIMASKDDEIVPYRLSENLSNHFVHGKEFVTYEGFNHNDYWGREEVLERIVEYIQEVINQ